MQTQCRESGSRQPSSDSAAWQAAMSGPDASSALETNHVSMKSTLHAAMFTTLHETSTQPCLSPETCLTEL